MPLVLLLLRRQGLFRSLPSPRNVNRSAELPAFAPNEGSAVNIALSRRYRTSHGSVQNLQFDSLDSVKFRLKPMSAMA